MGEAREQGYHTSYTRGHFEQLTVSTLDKATTL